MTVNLSPSAQAQPFDLQPSLPEGLATFFGEPCPATAVCAGCVCAALHSLCHGEFNSGSDRPLRIFSNGLQGYTQQLHALQLHALLDCLGSSQPATPTNTIPLSPFPFALRSGSYIAPSVSLTSFLRSALPCCAALHTQVNPSCSRTGG
jgi:hypothetical protein